MIWSDLYVRIPLRTEDGIPVFGRENDGDCFDEADVAQWRAGRLLSNWTEQNLLGNPATRGVLETIIREEQYAVDLACGPGMGLLPALNQLRPGFPGLATDANLSVLQEWQHVLRSLGVGNIALAQCSLMALPFSDNTVRAYTSMIGVSSTRGGKAGVRTALAEIYRTLAPGGRFYTIEAEWTDIPAILRLFERMGQQPWAIFLQQQSTWRERFLRAGFTILAEAEAEHILLRPEDNELGEAAAVHGMQIGCTARRIYCRNEEAARQLGGSFSVLVVDSALWLCYDGLTKEVCP